MKNFLLQHWKPSVALTLVIAILSSNVPAELISANLLGGREPILLAQVTSTAPAPTTTQTAPNATSGTTTANKCVDVKTLQELFSQSTQTLTTTVAFEEEGLVPEELLRARSGETVINARARQYLEHLNEVNLQMAELSTVDVVKYFEGLTQLRVTKQEDGLTTVNDIRMANGQPPIVFQFNTEKMEITIVSQNPDGSLAQLVFNHVGDNIYEHRKGTQVYRVLVTGSESNLRQFSNVFNRISNNLPPQNIVEYDPTTRRETTREGRVQFSDFSYLEWKEGLERERTNTDLREKAHRERLQRDYSQLPPEVQFRIQMMEMLRDDLIAYKNETQQSKAVRFSSFLRQSYARYYEAIGYPQIFSDFMGGSESNLIDQISALVDGFIEYYLVPLPGEEKSTLQKLIEANPDVSIEEILTKVDENGVGVYIQDPAFGAFIRDIFVGTHGYHYTDVSSTQELGQRQLEQMMRLSGRFFEDFDPAEGNLETFLESNTNVTIAKRALEFAFGKKDYTFAEDKMFEFLEDEIDEVIYRQCNTAAIREDFLNQARRFVADSLDSVRDFQQTGTDGKPFGPVFKVSLREWYRINPQQPHSLDEIERIVENTIAQKVRHLQRTCAVQHMLTIKDPNGNTTGGIQDPTKRKMFQLYVRTFDLNNEWLTLSKQAWDTVFEEILINAPGMILTVGAANLVVRLGIGALSKVALGAIRVSRIYASASRTISVGRTVLKALYTAGRSGSNLVRVGRSALEGLVEGTFENVFSLQTLEELARGKSSRTGAQWAKSLAQESLYELVFDLSGGISRRIFSRAEAFKDIYGQERFAEVSTLVGRLIDGAPESVKTLIKEKTQEAGSVMTMMVLNELGRRLEGTSLNTPQGQSIAQNLLGNQAFQQELLQVFVQVMSFSNGRKLASKLAGPDPFTQTLLGGGQGIDPRSVEAKVQEFNDDLQGISQSLQALQSLKTANTPDDVVAAIDAEVSRLRNIMDTVSHRKNEMLSVRIRQLDAELQTIREVIRTQGIDFARQAGLLAREVSITNELRNYRENRTMVESNQEYEDLVRTHTANGNFVATDEFGHVDLATGTWYVNAERLRAAIDGQEAAVVGGARLTLKDGRVINVPRADIALIQRLQPNDGIQVRQGLEIRVDAIASMEAIPAMNDAQLSAALRAIAADPSQLGRFINLPTDPVSRQQAVQDFLNRLQDPAQLAGLRDTYAFRLKRDILEGHVRHEFGHRFERSLDQSSREGLANALNIDLSQNRTQFEETIADWLAGNLSAEQMATIDNFFRNQIKAQDATLTAEQVESELERMKKVQTVRDVFTGNFQADIGVDFQRQAQQSTGGNVVRLVNPADFVRLNTASKKFNNLRRTSPGRQYFSATEITKKLSELYGIENENALEKAIFMEGVIEMMNNDLFVLSDANLTPDQVLQKKALEALRKNKKLSYDNISAVIGGQHYTIPGDTALVYYNPDNVLGEGSFGVVFKSVLIRGNEVKDVALKTFKKLDRNAEHELVVSRHMLDLQNQMGDDYPKGLIRVEGINVVRDSAGQILSAAIAQDLITPPAGKSLQLSEFTFDNQAQAEQVAIDLLQAVNDFHDLGFVSSDLKPENVGMRQNGDGTLSPVILDPGSWLLTGVPVGTPNVPSSVPVRSGIMTEVYQAEDGSVQTREISINQLTYKEKLLRGVIRTPLYSLSKNQQVTVETRGGREALVIRPTYVTRSNGKKAFADGDELSRVLSRGYMSGSGIDAYSVGMTFLRMLQGTNGQPLLYYRGSNGRVSRLDQVTNFADHVSSEFALQLLDISKSLIGLVETNDGKLEFDQSEIRQQNIVEVLRTALDVLRTEATPEPPAELKNKGNILPDQNLVDALQTEITQAKQALLDRVADGTTPAQRQLMEDTFIDQMTGLFNRGGLRLLDSMISAGKRVSVLSFDGDHFGVNNTVLSSKYGDYLIQVMGKNFHEMIEKLRAQYPDSGVTGVRMGGEEFVVFGDIPEAEMKAAMREMAAKLKDEIRSNFSAEELEALAQAAYNGKYLAEKEVGLQKARQEIGGSTAGVLEFNFGLHRIPNPSEIREKALQYTDQFLENGKKKAGRGSVYGNEQFPDSRADNVKRLFKFNARNDLGPDQNRMIEIERAKLAEEIDQSFQARLTVRNQVYGQYGLTSGQKALVDQFLQSPNFSRVEAEALAEIIAFRNGTNENGRDAARVVRDLLNMKTEYSRAIRDFGNYTGAATTFRLGTLPDSDYSAPRKIDVGEFKSINETMGHTHGDTFLMFVYNRVILDTARELGLRVDGANPDIVIGQKGASFIYRLNNSQAAQRQAFEAALQTRYGEMVQDLFNRMGSDEEGRSYDEIRTAWLRGNRQNVDQSFPNQKILSFEDTTVPPRMDQGENDDLEINGEETGEFSTPAPSTDLNAPSLEANSLTASYERAVELNNAVQLTLPNGTTVTAYRGDFIASGALGDVSRAYRLGSQGEVIEMVVKDFKLLNDNSQHEINFARHLFNLQSGGELRSGVIQVDSISPDGRTIAYGVVKTKDQGIKTLGSYQFQNPEEALRFFISFANAVNQLHSKGIYINDIKPANVLVNEDGEAVIIDIGSWLYEIRDGLSDELRELSVNKTSAIPYMISFTAAFTPPTGLASSRVSDAAFGVPGSHGFDLYSFGRTIESLMAGRLEWNNKVYESESGDRLGKLLASSPEIADLFRSMADRLKGTPESDFVPQIDLPGVSRLLTEALNKITNGEKTRSEVALERDVQDGITVRQDQVGAERALMVVLDQAQVPVDRPGIFQRIFDYFRTQFRSFMKLQDAVQDLEEAQELTAQIDSSFAQVPERLQASIDAVNEQNEQAPTPESDRRGYVKVQEAFDYVNLVYSDLVARGEIDPRKVASDDYLEENGETVEKEFAFVNINGKIVFNMEAIRLHAQDTGRSIVSVYRELLTHENVHRSFNQLSQEARESILKEMTRYYTGLKRKSNLSIDEKRLLTELAANLGVTVTTGQDPIQRLFEEYPRADMELADEMIATYLGLYRVNELAFMPNLETRLKLGGMNVENFMKLSHAKEMYEASRGYSRHSDGGRRTKGGAILEAQTNALRSALNTLRSQLQSTSESTSDFRLAGLEVVNVIDRYLSLPSANRPLFAEYLRQQNLLDSFEDQFASLRSDFEESLGRGQGDDTSLERKVLNFVSDFLQNGLTDLNPQLLEMVSSGRFRGISQLRFLTQLIRVESDSFKQSWYELQLLRLRQDLESVNDVFRAQSALENIENSSNLFLELYASPLLDLTKPDGSRFSSLSSLLGYVIPRLKVLNSPLLLNEADFDLYVRLSPELNEDVQAVSDLITKRNDLQEALAENDLVPVEDLLVILDAEQILNIRNAAGQVIGHFYPLGESDPFFGTQDGVAVINGVAQEGIFASGQFTSQPLSREKLDAQPQLSMNDILTAPEPEVDSLLTSLSPDQINEQKRTVLLNQLRLRPAGTVDDLIAAIESNIAIDLPNGIRVYPGRELGRGGIGAVHRGVFLDDQGNMVEVAVKRLLHLSRPGSQYSLRVAEHVSNNPMPHGLIKIYGVIKDRGYIVSQLVVADQGPGIEAGDYRWVKNSPHQGDYFLKRYLEILQDLHDRGIVVTDIKPANVLVQVVMDPQTNQPRKHPDGSVMVEPLIADVDTLVYKGVAVDYPVNDPRRDLTFERSGLKLVPYTPYTAPGSITFLSEDANGNLTMILPAPDIELVKGIVPNKNNFEGIDAHAFGMTVIHLLMSNRFLYGESDQVLRRFPLKGNFFEALTTEQFNKYLEAAQLAIGYTQAKAEPKEPVGYKLDGRFRFTLSEFKDLISDTQSHGILKGGESFTYAIGLESTTYITSADTRYIVRRDAAGNYTFEDVKTGVRQPKSWGERTALADFDIVFDQNGVQVTNKKQTDIRVREEQNSASVSQSSAVLISSVFSMVSQIDWEKLGKLTTQLDAAEKASSPFSYLMGSILDQPSGEQLSEKQRSILLSERDELARNIFASFLRGVMVGVSEFKKGV